MNNQEHHKYRVVGDEYVGDDRFVRVNKVIVADTPEEANYLAFRAEIIPTKIRDLGKTTEEVMAIL
jgi:hypothetical protein